MCTQTSVSITTGVAMTTNDEKLVKRGRARSGLRYPSAARPPVVRSLDGVPAGPVRRRDIRTDI